MKKKKKTSLVTTGIYSISRNSHFWVDLMYIGILFSFFNWFLALLQVLQWYFHLQIVNVEEDFLIEVFGNEYPQYK